MLDSELLLYNADDCGPGSEWSRLFDRIRSRELSKTWLGARVSDTKQSYPFGPFKMSGKAYDTVLLRENAQFVTHGQLHKCKTKICKRVRVQVRSALFSWWTDLPYLNLTVAARMLAAVGKQKREKPKEKPGAWCKLVKDIMFPRFEHVSYQQWTVLHEDFTFRDVTDLTGEAAWGSYMEDPPDGARLGELQPAPLWVSAKAVVRVARKVLPPLSKDEPPLLIFHADHETDHFGGDEMRKDWEQILGKMLGGWRRR